MDKDTSNYDENMTVKDIGILMEDMADFKMQVDSLTTDMEEIKNSTEYFNGLYQLIISMLTLFPMTFYLQPP